jgi:argininosuccinate synthase
VREKDVLACSGGLDMSVMIRRRYDRQAEDAKVQEGAKAR